MTKTQGEAGLKINNSIHFFSTNIAMFKTQNEASLKINNLIWFLITNITMTKTQGEAGLRINDLIKMFQYKYYNGQNPKKSWSKKSNEKYDKYLIHITYYYMHI